LIFSDARIRVGVRVTPSMGSSRTPTRGSIALTVRSISTGSPLILTPSASRNATGSGLSSSDGWRSPMACRRGAIFGSALSPIRGIEAWPARPSVVNVKRKTPFSAVHTG
jgi:hypothetical protein